jgi:hypothetical protein
MGYYRTINDLLSNCFNASSFNSQWQGIFGYTLFMDYPNRSVDVNGYDIGDVDEPEFVEMENTFTEMNASIMERIDQNEESSDDDNRENK